MKKCLVAFCKNYQSNHNVNFFKITEERYNSWMKAIGRNPSDKVSYDNVICSKHFKPEDVVKMGSRMQLKKNAVPSLNLKPSSLINKNKVSESESNRARDINDTRNSINFTEIISTDTDPLEITAPSSLSLFGDSVDNIEFVIESDNESEEQEIGTKNHPFVIHLTELKGQGKLLVNEHIPKIPVVNDTHYEVVNLDLDLSDAEEIKDEIKIETEEIQIISDEEAEAKLIHDDKDTRQQIELNADIPTKSKKQNTQCYVPDCNIYDEEEELLYWFRAPNDRNLRKLWDICIDRKDQRLHVGDLICHQHFHESDIIYYTDKNGVVLSKTLKNGAIPCINFYEGCCVPNCNNQSGHMYTFPAFQSSNFNLWLYMIKNHDLRKLEMKEVMRHRVCARHFERDCFESEFVLKSTAAPTLFLPDHDINQFSSKVVYQQLSKGISDPNKDTRLCCAYGNCTNNNHTDKRLFKFPEDPDRCIAWLTACHRGGLISTPEETVKTMASGKLGVCEDHFEQDCFECTGILKSDAVPKPPEGFIVDFIRRSIAFSDPSDSTVAEAFFINDQGRKILPSTSSGICSYRNCTSKVSAENPFFSFPVDPIRGEQWLKACGLMVSPSSRLQMLKNQQICSKHFDENMFESKYKLKPDAVPNALKKGDENSNRRVNSAPMRTSQMDPLKVIYCAVSTCPNNYGLTPGKGKFPNPSEDPERFDIWLQLIDNAALKDLSPKEVYEKYMVCMKHFEPQFYMKDGKVANLSKEAVPTKFLSADISWFVTSEYYKTRIQKYMDKPDSRFQKDSCLVHKQEKNKMRTGESDTTCVLEEDGIRFINTGHYIHAVKQPNSKRKFPYEVYKFFKSGYGLTDDIAIGENIKIHTAIIIDDNDESERQVLQQLLDKRKRI